MELQAIFDRGDRLYRFGDVVSGSVVVESESNCTYSEIWITYRWRTHGRGNRDQGEEKRLILAAEKMSLRVGERREFPFHFAAPNGPVTYHGHYLNVDWYLTAHAQRIPLGHLKSEQDFLLQAGEPTDAVVLGAKQVARKDLPVRLTEEAPASYHLPEVKAGSHEHSGLWSKVRSWLLILLAALLVWMSGTLLRKSLDWDLVLIYGIPLGALIFLAVVAQGILRNAYRRKLQLGEVWVRPDSVYAGSKIHGHVDFVAKRAVHLSGISASISARERIRRTVGTTTTTEIHVLDEKTYTRSFNEDLAEGRRIAFDCALPVGAEAPATFSSINNALEWTVMMKAELKGWPAWQKTLPITVLPPWRP